MKQQIGHIKRCLDFVDIFGTPAYALNVSGRIQVHSLPGVACSFLSVVIVALFGFLKLSHVLTRHNPQISQRENFD